MVHNILIVEDSILINDNLKKSRELNYYYVEQAFESRNMAEYENG